VYQGSQTYCDARVSASQDSGGGLMGTVAFSSTGQGTFSAVQCGQGNGEGGQGAMDCVAQYTPSSSGSQTITASYSGDPYNSPSSGQFSLTVNAVTQTSTSVSCGPSQQGDEQFSLKCTATVTGNGPTGNVTWTSSSSTGSFHPPVCRLDPRSQSCQVEYSDTSAGTVTITAKYQGDQANSPSSSSTTVTIPKAATTTSVSCTRADHDSNSVTCYVSVTGLDPTGQVSWATSSSKGSFSPAACTLADGHCSVTYTDTSTGSVTITAEYSGDSNNLASSGTATVTLG
jgi:hypothetical protein